MKPPSISDCKYRLLTWRHGGTGRGEQTDVVDSLKHSHTHTHTEGELHRRTEFWITMSRLWIPFLACCLLACAHAIRAGQIRTQATPIQYQPSDDDVIYEIQTSTSQQCIYICIQNPACVSALYWQQSACRGYRNQQTSDVRVDSDTEAWLITYEGKYYVIHTHTHTHTHTTYTHIHTHMHLGRIYSLVCLSIYGATKKRCVWQLPPDELRWTKFIYKCIDFTLCPCT